MKTYEEVNIEIIKLSEDIITSSSGAFDGEDDEFKDWT